MTLFEKVQTEGVKTEVLAFKVFGHKDSLFQFHAIRDCNWCDIMFHFSFNELKELHRIIGEELEAHE